METEPAERAGLAVRSALDAIRTWASTETGGWVIVGGLAATAVAIAGAAFLPSRFQPSPQAFGAPLDVTTASLTPTADLADFTVSPDAVQNLSHEQARIWNMGLPFSTDPIRPAAALITPATDIEAYGRALDCLAAAVYYEAASETPQGQAAVAQVVLNRARHPAYPRSVCGVVFQGSERVTGCQFSFTCDGAMARVPSPASWARARSIASAALNGSVVAAVGTATHYHTDWVAPYWAPRLSKITRIGTHIFYRWKGAWGLPSAFTGAYQGAEPVVPKMLALTTIRAEMPAEIMTAINLSPLPSADLAEPLAPLIVSHTTDAGRDGLLADPAMAEAPADPPGPVRVALVVQRDVPIMADPMVSPSAQPARQRQRIAAPSGW